MVQMQYSTANIAQPTTVAVSDLESAFVQCEEWRGFAVVGDEVINLLSRTQDSAKEIHQRLTIMLDTIEQWVELMNNNNGEANMCVESANAPHSKIDLVVDRIQNISNVATNIATAAEEQSVYQLKSKIILMILVTPPKKHH